MSFPQGINFRATADYVADSANHTSEIGTTANYPRTTPQGNTVGWEQPITGTRDRVTTNDARLCGVHFLTSTPGVSATYRIDLPAPGAYRIRLAAGDPTGQTNSKIELFDNTTSLGVLINHPGIPSDYATFWDATDVSLSAADWPTSNQPVTKTFSSTIARFRLGAGVSTNEMITHLYIEPVSGGADATPPSMNGSLTPSAISSTGFTLSWPAASDNVGVTGYETSMDGGSTWSDAGNVLTRTFTGRTPATAYATRVRAYDAAGNRATPLALTVTTSAATGTFTSDICTNNTETVLANANVAWLWVQGSVSAPDAFTTGTGTLSSAGVLTATVPVGAGFMLLRTDTGAVFYQEATVS